MTPVTLTMVSRPLITAVRRCSQLEGAVQPDTQGDQGQGQGLCSSMCMSVGINVAGVTTMFELLSDPKYELHSQHWKASQLD